MLIPFREHLDTAVGAPTPSLWTSLVNTKNSDSVLFMKDVPVGRFADLLQHINPGNPLIRNRRCCHRVWDPNSLQASVLMR